jgi:ribosomal protein S12 methylthiotransferase accessory factor
MADAVQRVAPTVARVLSDAGFEQLARSARGGGATGLIDLDTLPQRARSLVSRIQRAGLLLYLRDVTSSVGIAALDCACIERQLDGRHLVHVGTGCHPDARVAVSRAITEAAQSRLAHIQGGREDLTVIVRPPAPFEPSEVYGGGDLRPFSSVPSYEQPNVDDDIRLLVDRLASAGFSRVIAIDLTRPELSIPVIRVLIPGAETWSVFFTHGQRGYLGARANRAMWEATLSGAEAP